MNCILSQIWENVNKGGAKEFGFELPEIELGNTMHKEVFT